MRRAIGILLLTGVLLMWPLAASAGDLQSTGTTASRADFNGDGADDLAVAAPGENNFAGVVHVLYGSGGGLSATGSQLWSQDSPGIAGAAEPDDLFGSALASGDFNGDARADLAIGARGENNFAGVVHVLYGSGGGLSATGNQLWSQDSPGIAGVAEGSDNFGDALAPGDFDGDGPADLAIGAPGENSVAGVVHVLYGSGGGLSATGSQLWSQDSPGIAGVAESADFFGDALAAGSLSTSDPGTANPAAAFSSQRSQTAPERRPWVTRQRSPQSVSACTGSVMPPGRGTRAQGHLSADLAVSDRSKRMGAPIHPW
jgi:disulfide bond formation protein DsbB